MKPLSTATRDSLTSTTKGDIRLQYKGIRTGKHRTVTAFAYIMP